MLAYTDGACSGNPGPGGWGVVICADGVEIELSGGEARTTNNRMELTAAIKAIEAAPDDRTLEIRTDSEYLKKGITEWLPRWKARGWRTSSRKPVKNQDLWRRLDDLTRARAIRWRWVRGHAGDEGNERADALARAGMRPFQ